MPTDIDVPTTDRLMRAGGDAIAGGLGGVVYDIVSGLVSRFAGDQTAGTISAPLAGAASAVVAGAMIPGTRGEIIATIGGFQAGQQIGSVTVGPLVSGFGG